jgi:hypothetical protein
LDARCPDRLRCHRSALRFLPLPGAEVDLAQLRPAFFRTFRTRAIDRIASTRMLQKLPKRVRYWRAGTRILARAFPKISSRRPRRLLEGSCLDADQCLAISAIGSRARHSLLVWAINKSHGLGSDRAPQPSYLGNAQLALSIALKQVPPIRLCSNGVDRNSAPHRKTI